MKPTVPSAPAAILDALPEGASVFDLRSEAERARHPLEGARVLALEDLQAGRLPDAPRARPLILVCERGLLSELGALYLEAAGFAEVYSVAGGLRAWRGAS